MHNGKIRRTHSWAVACELCGDMRERARVSDALREFEECGGEIYKLLGQHGEPIGYTITCESAVQEFCFPTEHLSQRIELAAQQLTRQVRRDRDHDAFLACVDWIG